jgi:hypothetical protein
MSNLSSFLGGGINRATAVTATGTFNRPSNVSWVSAMLVGGGSGGMNSGGAYGATGPYTSGGGGGGGGAIVIYDKIYLTGNLTVTIGAGGSGGIAANINPTAPTAGGDTTITSNFPGSPTFTAPGNIVQRTNGTYGAGGYPNFYSIQGMSPVTFWGGGDMAGVLAYNTSYLNDGGYLAQTGVANYPFFGGGGGGYGSNGVGNGASGYASGLSVAGGAGGVDSSAGHTGMGGGGGGAAIGAGGAGGNVNSGSTPSAGSNAASNTGAGGGGGAAVSGSGTNGGAGGSGYALICYVGTV